MIGSQVNEQEPAVVEMPAGGTDDWLPSEPAMGRARNLLRLATAEIERRLARVGLNMPGNLAPWSAQFPVTAAELVVALAPFPAIILHLLGATGTGKSSFVRLVQRAFAGDDFANLWCKASADDDIEHELVYDEHGMPRLADSRFVTAKALNLEELLRLIGEFQAIIKPLMCGAYGTQLVMASSNPAGEAYRGHQLDRSIAAKCCVVPFDLATPACSRVEVSRGAMAGLKDIGKAVSLIVDPETGAPVLDELQASAPAIRQVPLDREADILLSALAMDRCMRAWGPLPEAEAIPLDVFEALFISKPGRPAAECPRDCPALTTCGRIGSLGVDHVAAIRNTAQALTLMKGAKVVDGGDRRERVSFASLKAILPWYLTEDGAGLRCEGEVGHPEAIVSNWAEAVLACIRRFDAAFADVLKDLADRPAPQLKQAEATAILGFMRSDYPSVALACLRHAVDEKKGWGQ